MTSSNVIVSHLNDEIAQLAEQGASSYIIEPPIIDYLFVSEAVRIDTENDLRGHQYLTVLSQKNPDMSEIAMWSKMPHNVNLPADEHRVLSVRADAIKLTTKIFPYQVRISTLGVVSSTTPLNALAVKHLATAAQMTEELCLIDSVRTSSDTYKCFNGKNGKNPTEVTIADLSNASEILDTVGAQKINSEIVATRDYNTSPVPRSYSGKFPLRALNIIKQTPGIKETIISAYQWAGAQNFCDRLWGVSGISGIAFVGTNFYGPSPFLDIYENNTISDDMEYEGIISGSDCYMLGTSPMRSGIMTIDPAHGSPTGLYSTKGVRCAVVNGVLRPHGILRFKFTKAA